MRMPVPGSKHCTISWLAPPYVTLPIIPVHVTYPLHSLLRGEMTITQTQQTSLQHHPALNNPRPCQPVTISLHPRSLHWLDRVSPRIAGPVVGVRRCQKLQHKAFVRRL